jgi:transitional endoplasmic reticulum ATPase
MARDAALRFRDEIQTNTVKLKNTGLDESAKLALLESGNRQAIFLADVESGDVFNTEGPTVKANPRIAELFPGNIDPASSNNRVSVEEVQSQQNLQECKQVSIAPVEGSERAVRNYLESGSRRLIRPITEQLDTDSGTIRFRVKEPRPMAPCQTYIVIPGETDINYVSQNDRNEEQATEGGDEDDDLGQPYSTRLKDVDVEDVVGLSEVKTYAKSLIELYNDNTYADLVDKYSESLISKQGSVLLYGPPGCGKTMISQAIANEFVQTLDRDVVYMQVSGSDILSKLQGQSEKKVRKVFTDARDNASNNDFTVLFFDEVESLVRDRNASGLQSSQVSITNEFLNQMNDLPENVVVIGATNMPFKMDSAASRRFHTKLFCPHPDGEEMARKWELSIGDVTNRESMDGDDYERLGKATEKYTPAEIDDRILGSLVQTEIIEEYTNGNPKTITLDYLLSKIDETEPRTIPEYVAKMESQLRHNRMEGYSEIEEYIQEHHEPN